MLITTLAVQQNLASVLLDLLPLMIGAAVVPIPIVIVLLLLSNQRGLFRATAFIGGAIVVRLAQGIAFGLIFTSDPAATTDTGGNLIVSTLLMVLGILMLITAYRKWDKDEDPDAPPPRWITAVGSLSPLKAFGIGAAVVAISTKQWVFTLSVIGVLSRAHLGPPASIGLFVGYVLAAQVFGLIAVIAYALSPQRAGGALTAIGEWLKRNDRQILIAASLIFGLFFLFKGITGLLG
jgi:hypothetical protein